MAFEKILILESSWAESDDRYVADSRSTSKIYSGIESLLSIHDKPVFSINRPLLKDYYISHIEQFIKLPSNKKGINVIVLSAHGSHELIEKGDRSVHRRILKAIDGDINISKDIRKLSKKLNKSIFILDACNVGVNSESFREASCALGVIGFSEATDWIDSSVFILALLLKFQAKGIYNRSNISRDLPDRILKTMESGSYRSLFEKLGVNYSFGAA